MNLSKMNPLPAVLTVGALAGAAIWFLSPMITGQAEPWDAGGPYFLVALFLAGASASCVAPRYFWAAPIGMYLGQLAYALLFLPTGPLMMLGAVMLFFCCLPGLVGGSVVWALAKVLDRNRPDAGPPDEAEKPAIAAGG